MVNTEFGLIKRRQVKIVHAITDFYMNREEFLTFRSLSGSLAVLFQQLAVHRFALLKLIEADPFVAVVRLTNITGT